MDLLRYWIYHMQILTLSDIHLESSVFNHTLPFADVVVLAGDIGFGTEGIEWADKIDAEVMYVLGNHEFEGKDYDKVLESCRELALKSGHINVLQQDEAIIGNTRFLGCTMWTDFELYGSAWRPAARRSALQGMPEYATIFKNNKLLHVSDTEKMHYSDRDWLKTKLRTPFDGDTVVITHHAPHINSVSEQYKDNLLSAAFASDLTDLLGRNPLWLHGHVHSGFDYEVDGTRIVCNPRGRHKIKNKCIYGFDLHKIIELDNDYMPRP